jgi:type III secretion protein F
MAAPTLGSNSVGSQTLWSTYLVNTNPTQSQVLDNTGPYNNRDGFDLVWLQSYLQTTMANVEDDIRSIEQNANLSDTEKMFSMQMAMNTWSAVSNLRTNMMKSVADTLKSITRNVS